MSPSDAKQPLRDILRRGLATSYNPALCYLCPSCPFATFTTTQDEMMTIYRIAGDDVQPVKKTTFQAEDMLERRDLQKLLRRNIDLLVPDGMVLAEEFGD